MFWRAIVDKNKEQRLGECTGGLAAQLAGGLAMMTSRFDITVPCFSFSFECFDHGDPVPMLATIPCFVYPALNFTPISVGASCTLAEVSGESYWSSGILWRSRLISTAQAATSCVADRGMCRLTASWRVARSVGCCSGGAERRPALPAVWSHVELQRATRHTRKYHPQPESARR